MTVHVNSLFAQTEGGMMVVFLKEDWEKRRVHGETSKSNWFLKEIKKKFTDLFRKLLGIPYPHRQSANGYITTFC